MTDTKAQNLRFLLMKTIADLAKSLTDDERKNVQASLLELFEATDSKSFAVRIPGGEKVATFTLNEPSPKNKIDSEALLDWARTNRPDLVETVYHPATEAWQEQRLCVSAEAEIVRDFKLAGTSYITADGEPVVGIEYVPSGAPKSFTVRYEKGGQERVIEAWRDGELPGIDLGGSLPMIGDAP